MDSRKKIKLKIIVLLMIHFEAEAQQNVMQLTAVNFFFITNCGC